MSEGTSHIFSASNQPATDFMDYTFGPPERIVCSPFAIRRCWKCRKRRIAKNLTVQVFYDGNRYFCSDTICKIKK